ncbi:MAG: nucleotidyltransferase domain-containing protein [Planctomycetes bacterium]|nr:nucleotidyltransferase domain-containing protein [Planctomycetota bacterium]
MILPVGTQVVTRVTLPATAERAAMAAGAVGVIVKAPTDQTHAYRIQLVSGIEVSLKRDEFSIRKQDQQAGLSRGTACDEAVLRRGIILRVVVGSRAYGLARDESDTDRRGVYVPPAELHWSLFGVPEQIESDESQECYWEIGKFLVLALKANPNVLECLYSPMVEFTAPLGRELLDMREAFLSRLVYQTYNGYVLSQFHKLEQDLRSKGAVKWKHAMHLIRLLLSGITVLREGFVPVRVDEHRERLLAIRDGAVDWDEVNAWRLELHKEFDAAFAATKLPEQPDYARVDAFLIKVRREQV